MVPYIVSADIKLLLERWAERRGFTLPDGRFFSRLREGFSGTMGRIFPDFVLISEEELTEGLCRLAAQSAAPVVSIDRVYCSTKPSLDITRHCRGLENGKPEVAARHGSPPLSEQIETISRQYREITLLDDVVYSGDQMEEIVRLLEGSGIRVVSIIAGIGIGEGMERIGALGLEMRCVRAFPHAVDEVCERDFYPGVPFCGRTMVNGVADTGAPYLLPCGNPEKWASIPEGETAAFSAFCLEQTAKLFSEIERLSGRPVLCADLDRQIYGIDGRGGSILEALQSLKARLN